MPLGVESFSELGRLIKTGASMEAQVKLLEVRSQTLDLQEEILGLRKRVSELEAELEIRGKLVFEAPYYWLGDVGGREGPYCQACWDKDAKLTRLQGSGQQGAWHCAVCKNHYRDRSWRPMEMVVAKSDWLSR